MFDEHEPAEFGLASDLAAIERQLARLTPAAPRIDRDRLMFAAGRETAIASQQLCEVEPSPNPSLIGRETEAAATLCVAGPRRWFWPAATAAMTAATLLLATLLVWQRAAQPIAVKGSSPPPTVVVATPPPVESLDANAQAATPPLETADITWPMASPPTTGYLGLRYVALTRGIGALEEHDLAASSTSDSSGNEPATQRELLRELLPAANRTASPRS